jgi:hypothetical protein
MAEKTASVTIPSVKLTGMDRDGIVRRALEHAFAKEDAALAKRDSALARRCYNAIFPLSIRKMVEALPPGWTEETTKPNFNVGGLHIAFKSEEALRIPSRGGYQRLGDIKDRALIDAVNELLAARKDRDERRKQVEAATKAIVNSCGTTKQLREIWPQGEQFYRHIEPAARVNLPAAQIQQLNEMLGLKKAA